MMFSGPVTGCPLSGPGVLPSVVIMISPPRAAGVSRREKSSVNVPGAGERSGGGGGGISLAAEDASKLTSSCGRAGSLESTCSQAEKRPVRPPASNVTISGDIVPAAIVDGIDPRENNEASGPRRATDVRRSGWSGPALRISSDCVTGWATADGCVKERRLRSVTMTGSGIVTGVPRNRISPKPTRWPPVAPGVPK